MVGSRIVFQNFKVQCDSFQHFQLTEPNAHPMYVEVSIMAEVKYTKAQYPSP